MIVDILDYKRNIFSRVQSNGACNNYGEQSSMIIFQTSYKVSTVNIILYILKYNIGCCLGSVILSE